LGYPDRALDLRQGRENRPTLQVLDEKANGCRQRDSVHPPRIHRAHAADAVPEAIRLIEHLDMVGTPQGQLNRFCRRLFEEAQMLAAFHATSAPISNKGARSAAI
jgi:hypothetical protein